MIIESLSSQDIDIRIDSGVAYGCAPRALTRPVEAVDMMTIVMIIEIIIIS